MRRSQSAAICVALASFAGCTVLQSGLANRTSVPEVERWVDAALPIGSSREQIETWLTEQGIEHKFTTIPLVEDIGIHSREVGHCRAVVAEMSNPARSFFVTRDIRVYFVLGEDCRLILRMVERAEHGSEPYAECYKPLYDAASSGLIRPPTAGPSQQPTHPRSPSGLNPE